MVSYDKMSKKAQKAINQKKRTTWEGAFGCAMPHSYIKKNAKVYNRKTKHKTAYYN